MAEDKPPKPNPAHLARLRKGKTTLVAVPKDEAFRAFQKRQYNEGRILDFLRRPRGPQFQLWTFLGACRLYEGYGAVSVPTGGSRKDQIGIRIFNAARRPGSESSSISPRKLRTRLRMVMGPRFSRSNSSSE